jgi:hypothetical protein
LRTILQQSNSLSAAAPDWLSLGFDHRTPYETFNHRFTWGTAGRNQQVHQRTRILLVIRNIRDPFRFTLEVGDSGHLRLIGGRITNRFLSITWIFFNFTLTSFLKTLLTGSSCKLGVGHLIMDFGKGRTVSRIGPPPFPIFLVRRFPIAIFHGPMGNYMSFKWMREIIFKPVTFPPSDFEYLPNPLKSNWIMI